jgi:hypothetical protein
MSRWLITVLVALLCSPAGAQQAELVGVWKLTSFVVESVQTKERRNVYGPALAHCCPEPECPQLAEGDVWPPKEGVRVCPEAT